MKNTQLAGLKEGQPIMFRLYSGQTENGAGENKMLFSSMMVMDYLGGLLTQERALLLQRWTVSSPEARKFIQGAVYNWASNHDEEFDKWYKQTSPEVKAIMGEMDLGIQQIEGFGNLYRVTKAHSLVEVPKDMSLPAQISEEIAKREKDIDEDKGWARGKLGVIKTSTPAGYVDAFTFELGDNHNLGRLKLARRNLTMSANQVTPITRDALLSGLQTEMENYHDLIAKGGLEGAVEARKQFLLAKLYQKLQVAESNEQIHQIMGSDNRFPAPETGIYVLIGGNGKEPNLSAVRVNPRYDEDKVAGLMGVLTATERGFETLRFQALEVPEVALKYIQNPKTLEVRLS